MFALASALALVTLALALLSEGMTVRTEEDTRPTKQEKCLLIFF